jgi:hypothetical protein
MQDNQDKETSTDKVQSTREYKKIIPLDARGLFIVFACAVSFEDSATER